MDEYQRAVQAWGIVKQLGQVQEECGELITAINKYLNRGKSDQNVIDEAADVRLLVNQVEAIFGKERFEEAFQRKRLIFLSRLENCENSKKNP